jgi:phosphotransferase system enzyme I (PtsI)
MREPAESRMTNSAQLDQRFQGTPLSPGCATARICMFDPSHHQTVSERRIEPARAADEQARVRAALWKVAGQLEEIRQRVEREIGHAEAGIFSAQKMIVEDPGLEKKIMDGIGSRNMDAESAVSEALNAFEDKLLAFDDEYMKERASDFGELRRRLIDVLTGAKPVFACSESGCRRGNNRIVVTGEITPYLTMELDTGNVLGFVSERGGPTSHAAILARALGIPAVSNIPGIRERVHCGAEILINGDTGEVVLWPSEKTVAGCRAKHSLPLRAPAPEPPVPGIALMANINMPGDTAFAVEMLAEGIGLYRTEFELMFADRQVTEESLSTGYASVLRAMGEKPVIFRMFDIGGDKQIPSVHVEPEDNPALGLRGARLLLKNKGLFRLQARALAAASRSGTVRLMYPMVATREQFLRLRDVFEDSVRDMRVGRVLHGTMFVVPSACLDADSIFAEADFGSIGTNDLAQYLFAADRNNAEVADDLIVEHPSFIRIIRMLSEAAAARGRELSVCGEMAGNLRYVDILIGAGIRSLSVNPRRIPLVRQHLRTREQVVA